MIILYVDPKLYAAEELANAIIIKQAADNRKIFQENLRIFLRRFVDKVFFFWYDNNTSKDNKGEYSNGRFI